MRRGSPGGTATIYITASPRPSSVKSIRSVTLEEVQRAASRYLHPDHLLILIVGDRQRLGEQLKSPGKVEEIPLMEVKVE